jgi:polyhydroxybutyrate depolymerase
VRRSVLVTGVVLVLVASASALAVPRLKDGGSSAPSLAQVRHVTGNPVLVGIESGGQKRQYRLYTPNGLPAGKRVPLEVVLDDESFPFPELPDWERLAQAQQFLLALPVTESRWKDPADISFVGDMINELVAKDGVDPDRVYLTGGSHSGRFAYQIACSPVGSRVAGVGGLFAYVITTVAGPAALAADCHPTHPISIINIHGTDDSLIPLEGKPCQIGKESGQPICLHSQLEVMRYWAQVDGCPADPSAADAGAIRTYVWQGCKAGTAVELMIVKGGGHTVDSLVVDGVSPHLRIWNFLQAHPRQQKASSQTLQGRVVRVQVSGTGAARRIAARVSVSARVTARLALIRGVTRVAASPASTIAGGAATLRLVVPKRLGAGRYVLRVTIHDGAGHTVVLRRPVVLSA